MTGGGATLIWLCSWERHSEDMVPLAGAAWHRPGSGMAGADAERIRRRLAADGRLKICSGWVVPFDRHPPLQCAGRQEKKEEG